MPLPSSSARHRLTEINIFAGEPIVQTHPNAPYQSNYFSIINRFPFNYLCHFQCKWNWLGRSLQRIVTKHNLQCRLLPFQHEHLTDGQQAKTHNTTRDQPFFWEICVLFFFFIYMHSPPRAFSGSAQLTSRSQRNEVGDEWSGKWWQALASDCGL